MKILDNVFIAVIVIILVLGVYGLYFIHNYIQ